MRKGNSFTFLPKKKVISWHITEYGVPIKYYSYMKEIEKELSERNQQHSREELIF